MKKAKFILKIASNIYLFLFDIKLSENILKKAIKRIIFGKKF